MNLFTYGVDIDTDVFPANYAQGRALWLKQLADLSGHLIHKPYTCAGQGPEGEALVTNTVWLGSEDASRVVVVLSATHGVEGFTGSAVQIDLLRALLTKQGAVPDDGALLLVHALTPWGYAWSRRCDEAGVDLNRNVVDFTVPLPENRGYERLRPFLYEANADRRQAAFNEFALQHGRTALEIAISGGQYRDPTGPFYGGQEPAHGRLVCEDLIVRYGLGNRRLAVVDIHTGLGPYGYGEIICDHKPDSAGATIAKRWYGDSVTLPLAGTSSSVPKLGLLDYLWHGVMDRNSCYVTLEFGTFSTDALFETLLRDHQLWSQSGNWTERMAHADLMRRHFCPADRAWREMVLFRARQVLGQAMRGVWF